MQTRKVLKNGVNAFDEVIPFVVQRPLFEHMGGGSSTGREDMAYHAPQGPREDLFSHPSRGISPSHFLPLLFVFGSFLLLLCSF